MDRKEALKKVNKKENNRVVFVADYHPALPSFSSILKSSWTVMVKDPYMKKVFPEPPLVAYRKPRNSALKDILVKTKVPPLRQRRVVKGMSKCNKPNCGV